MNTSFLKNSILAAACAFAVSGTAAQAQESVVSTSSTVTSDGVVQQFEPSSSQIVVSSTGSAAPTRYTYNKTTTFVDASGNVVSQESIKQNTPARIYYTKVGDSYVVTKFVANPTVTTQVVTPAAPAPVVEETTTTTTTTKK
jgi:hypothetical protein